MICVRDEEVLCNPPHGQSDNQSPDHPNAVVKRKFPNMSCVRDEHPSYITLLSQAKPTAQSTYMLDTLKGAPLPLVDLSLHSPGYLPCRKALRRPTLDTTTPILELGGLLSGPPGDAPLAVALLLPACKCNGDQPQSATHAQAIFMSIIGSKTSLNRPRGESCCPGKCRPCSPTVLGSAAAPAHHRKAQQTSLTAPALRPSAPSQPTDPPLSSEITLPQQQLSVINAIE